MRDEAADDAEGSNVAAAHPNSVLTGRTIEEVGEETE